MSDATGFASGGISEVLTVGAAASGANCNATVPSPDWQYDLNTALQQCRPYTFGPYTDPVQPVTVYGLVPGGNLLTLPLPNRTGGASDLYTVGLSDDATCLNGQSPSSTVQPTSSTAAPVTGSATSSSSPTALPSASRNISYGTVAAVIIGGLIGLAAIGGLVVFLMRQRKKESSPFYSKQGHIDLDDGHETPALLPSRYQAEPFTLTTPTPYELATLDSTTNLISNANDDRNASVSSASALPRKGQSGDARYQPARFILHTDAEEINPDENGVVELPPQYSAARRPLPGAPQQSTTSNPFESPDPRPP
ncbi:hypothetical protein BV25DRAFT_582861 [Artomyces pyxidatus]|uniref:Uncharacterized protein n=1 Tax=Artomyces pyxidatus TaxID=48021 RepID=A0ACB8TJ65_9AGAM|nr:hypothetical protein BV25DRAFT_582861 [Artomyces pyxidatus]